jgi:phosphotransferase system enzyme I (PtsI)
MLLEDMDAINETEIRLRAEHKNVGFCYYTTIQKVIDTIVGTGSYEYLRDRVVDLEDVRAAVLAKLAGDERSGLEGLDEFSIVVAHTLTPSDTARMQASKVVGFVTDRGGPTSHAAILARSLDIPAVVGCQGASVSIAPGETVVINGYSGEIYVEPDDLLKAQIVAWQQQLARRIQRLREISLLPAQTRDGRRISLELNLELEDEIKRTSKTATDGVGLFRTEFLFLSREDWPGEDEQYAVYRELAESFGGRPVTIRTMDIGGDKLCARLHVTREMNPFLGWRAIRISLAQPDVFRVQLRAILRASAHGNVRLMFPMVTSLDELDDALEILDEAKRELASQGTPHNHTMPVGVMIETPSAVMIADALAKKVAFFSIGTNDLVQYTLAVDRDNQRVAKLFDMYHPAVLRLVHNTIKSGHNARIPVSVCGEMAHEPLAVLLLVGLGIDGLSMALSGIPEIRRIIRRTTLLEAKEVARAALVGVTGTEVRRTLESALLAVGSEIGTDR